MKKVIFFLMALEFCSSFAQGDGRTIKVRVEYGEKTSFFEVLKEPAGFLAKFRSNQKGDSGVAPLSQVNYDYLLSMVDKFGPPKDTTSTCGRTNIHVISENGETKAWAACLRGQNDLARRLRKLVKDLTRLF